MRLVPLVHPGVTLGEWLKLVTERYMRWDRTLTYPKRSVAWRKSYAKMILAEPIKVKQESHRPKPDRHIVPRKGLLGFDGSRQLRGPDGEAVELRKVLTKFRPKSPFPD